MQKSAAQAKNAKVPEALATPNDLDRRNVAAVTGELNSLVADAFALYVKTKNFHWHMNGPHFRDYHLLLDEQAEQIFATIDPLAERVRKLGQRTLLSIGHIGRLQSVEDNDKEFMAADAMLAELMADNRAMAARFRQAHKVCEDNDDPATAGLLETYIDETERRTWFLFEASQRSEEPAR
ncbi:MAG: DNA starvation/stationary phase protection protein [Hyphomicrobiaceae bacterium]|nr:DNA starvation/stationary phase protection protein [Hyphomicrobiaceae bacterium]